MTMRGIRNCRNGNENKRNNAGFGNEDNDNAETR